REPSPAARELMLVAARKKHRAVPAFIEEMARSVQSSRNADQINTLGTLLESSQVREIVPDRTLQKLSDFGLRLAGDSKLDLHLRVAGVRLVGYGAEQRVSVARGLAAFLAPQTPEELQEAAVRRLGGVGAAAQEELIKAWRGLGPRRRAAALTALLSQE